MYDVKRMRMDDVLSKLSEDIFYLDSKYIYSRIFYNEENVKYYNSLLDEK